MNTKEKTAKKATAAKTKAVGKRRSNSDIIPQNKYMEAALKHQGSFIVYDPHFML